MMKLGANPLQYGVSMPMEVAVALTKKGAKTAIVRRCGVPMSTIQNWGNIPLKYVDVVADITGLTKEQIRPDRFAEKEALPKRTCLRCRVRFIPETRLFFMCKTCRLHARACG